MNTPNAIIEKLTKEEIEEHLREENTPSLLTMDQRMDQAEAKIDSLQQAALNI